MSSQPNSQLKLAVSSQCLPGSVAEQKEKERIEQFLRDKAERKAQEAREKPLQQQQRQEAYDAHKDQLHQRRMPGSRP